MPVLSEASRCLLEVEVDPEHCIDCLTDLSEIIEDANHYQSKKKAVQKAKQWIGHINSVKRALELSPKTGKSNTISINHQVLLEEFWKPLVSVQDHAHNIVENFSDTQLQQRVWIRIGDLYLEQGEDLETLINTYQKAGDDCASTWIGKGRAYLNERKYPEAVKCFNSAIDRDATSFEVYAFRGQAYRLQEEWEIASENYKRALDLREDVGWVWLESAQVYHQLKDYPRAQKSFQKALRLGLGEAREFSSEEIAAHLGLAEVSVELEDYDTATEEWSWLIDVKEGSKERDEELGEFYIWRAKALSQMGEEDKAIQDREQAKAIYLEMAEGSMESKDYVTAAEKWSRLIEIKETSKDKDLGEFYARCGQAYRLQEEWKIASENYERALDLREDVGWVWLESAQVYQHLEDYPRAQKSFQKALRLGLEKAGDFSPEESVAHRGLAEVSMELEDYVTAFKEWSWLIEMKERSSKFPGLEDVELDELYDCKNQARQRKAPRSRS